MIQNNSFIGNLSEDALRQKEIGKPAITTNALKKWAERNRDYLRGKNV